MGRFTGVLGMAVILGLAWLFSTDRRAIKLKTIAWGLGLQLALGFFVLRSGVGSSVFGFLGAGANKLLSFSYAGSAFVFGDIGQPKELSGWAFRLPSRCFPRSSLLRLLCCSLSPRRDAAHHPRCGVDYDSRDGRQRSRIPQRRASIFMGQTEAPLTIRPFLPKLTKSELMVVMTSGMAHISGGMMAGYIQVGAPIPKTF